MGIGGDDGAGFVPDRGVGRRGGGEEGIEEVGVAVAHESEDVVDVPGERVRDVRRGVRQERAFREIWRVVHICLA